MTAQLQPSRQLFEPEFTCDHITFLYYCREVEPHSSPDVSASPFLTDSSSEILLPRTSISSLPLNPDSINLSPGSASFELLDEPGNQSSANSEQPDESPSFLGDLSFLSSSSAERELDEELIRDEMLEPLYEGASISIAAAYCSIMRYAISSKLSYTAIGSLLMLLQLLCPSPNHLPTSFYKLKKFFQGYQSDFKKKRVCPHCERVLEKGKSCPRSHGKSGHIIHVPIQKALATVVKST